MSVFIDFALVLFGSFLGYVVLILLLTVYATWRTSRWIKAQNLKIEQSKKSGL